MAGLRLRAKTAKHLQSLSQNREYLVTRYGPELAATDDNWDGYNAICCYSKPGKDPRVEADKAGFVAQSNAAGGNKVRVVAASVGLSYNAIVAACAAKPSAYANHQASCPPADVLP